MKGAFITGTDTGVGKTYFTTFWTRSLRQAGVPVLPLKPISSGDRSDAESLYRSVDGTIPIEEINPIHFNRPLAPLTACRISQQVFPRESLHRHLDALQSKYPGPFLIEGVGGWRVPFEQNFGVREWARELNLPVVVVARAGLGTLNHVLLTIDSILQAHLPVLGIILNLHQALDDDATRTNPPILQELTGLPIFLLPAQAKPVQELPLWLSFRT